MNTKFCGMRERPITYYRPHHHNCWEITLQLSGTVKPIIGDKVYDISAGDIMIIPPGVTHEGCSDIPYTDIYVQCENMDVSKVTILHDYDGYILELMNMLHRVFTQKGSSYKIIADSILQTITLYLHNYINADYKYEFVNDLKNEMYSNLSNCNFEISEFAKKTGYNLTYLRRCFKSDTGKTPLEYLTDMRLNYSKGLLRDENFISVVDVAEKCGYKDSFYFSRLFKQHNGMSPLNYRKKHNAANK